MNILNFQIRGCNCANNHGGVSVIFHSACSHRTCSSISSFILTECKLSSTDKYKTKRDVTLLKSLDCNLKMICSIPHHSLTHPKFQLHLM